MESAGCILVQCAQCSLRVDSPEDLCDHAARSHRAPTRTQRKRFEDRAQFHAWLACIESARASSSGIVAGTLADISDSNQGEYYLLCGNGASPLAKRRKLGCAERPDDMTHSSAESEHLSLVCCTAFVHVRETVEEGVCVTYCLEHSPHSPDVRRKHMGKRTALKRSVRELAGDGTEEALDLDYASTSSSASSSAHSSPLHPFEPEVPSLHVSDLTIDPFASPLVVSSPESSSDGSSMDSVDVEIVPMEVPLSPPKTSLNQLLLNDLSEFDLTSVNSHISQRLDSTADRLKALTKVLAKLAVDINACDTRISERRDCEVVV